MRNAKEEYIVRRVKKEMHEREACQEKRNSLFSGYKIFSSRIHCSTGIYLGDLNRQGE